MIYLQLFLSFLQIGAFSIGGGYAAMPLIQNQVVTLHGWLTMTEFTDLITIAEMTPGPIAVNSATFVGTHIAGLPGALIATAGCILPSCIIVSILAYCYYKYRQSTMIQDVLSTLRPVVVALIASAGLNILIMAFWNGTFSLSGILDANWANVVFFAIAMFLLRKFKMNPIHVMLLCGLAGVVTKVVLKI
ncbi:chromate transporter [Anaerolentibacter hominis]|uniref:chromate transporter n=1 Tax=Anaerolentibacter hominis TaxID=3079009 RepID=UPI0031B89D8C